MSKRQIVQEQPLTPGELRDWHIAILSELPSNPSPTKVRADLKNKSALGRAYGKLFRDRYAAEQDLIDVDSWADFYQHIFVKAVDLSNLQVPAKPEYECWPIVIVPGLITNNDAFDACKKQMGNAWRYTDDLNTVVDIVERPKTPYVVWVRAVIEADSDLGNTSAKAIEERHINTLTLLERLILDSKHFDETKEYLDIENVTLCAGSRYAGGRVPDVRWHPTDRELSVDWNEVRYAAPHLRARAAVS